MIEYRPPTACWCSASSTAARYGNADVADPANTERIAAACRRLHAARRFGNDFDMFEIQPRYRSVIQTRGLRLPAGYDDLAAQFEAARAALAARDEGTVPCNNDLLAANFIDDGERIWLIDYEYSGNNDPCFELGNIAAESGLSPDALAALVTAYYGRARRSRIARAQLFGLVARYGWTLWGAIQQRDQPAGLRLLVVGDGEVRRRRGRIHRARLRPAARRRAARRLTAMATQAPQPGQPALAGQAQPASGPAGARPAPARARRGWSSSAAG